MTKVLSCCEKVASISDEQLLVHYRETGNRDSFTCLVRRYEGELFNYLRRYLGNAEEAEDVFQTTFTQIHLKLPHFDQRRKFRPWLYTIATNQAIDLKRRNKRHRAISLQQEIGSSGYEAGQLAALIPDRLPNPVEFLTEQENRNWVSGQLAKLPDPMQQVVQLVYYQGLKYREAADVLGIPVGTIKSRLHSAVLKLASAWKERQISTFSEKNISKKRPKKG
ncbi:MAG: RNA polymerase sigma factor [Pirellulaceae bacterium]|nr:RNA polymerase sigma factor [Pirellulaceae bacterium]